jgi:integrase
MNGSQNRSAKAGPSARWRKLRWLLGFATSYLGDRPIAEITAPEVLAVLRKIEARGRYETARMVRSTCSQVFRYAIATGRAERDPANDLRGALTAPKVKHRAAVTDPRQLAPCCERSMGLTVS